MTKIESTAFQKSLKRLEDMAKGQLFHTSGDSDPSGWAGSDYKAEPEKDGIDENGTDYNGMQKSAIEKSKTKQLTPAELALSKGEDHRPALADKISKGETLTSIERALAKGGFAMPPKAPMGAVGGGMMGKSAEGATTKDMKKDPTEAGEDEASAAHAASKVTKSLASEVKKSEVLAKGIRMSPFLFEFTKATEAALEGVEARVSQNVVKALTPLAQYVEHMAKGLASFESKQIDFNSALGEAVIGLAQGVSASAEQAVAKSTEAARGPKTQLRSVANGTQVVQKSFGPGGLDVGIDSLMKSQIVDAMTELSKAGKIAPLEVIKFESTNQFSPGTQEKVAAYVRGTR